ncbi:MAG: ThiF family adenylyltransferase [Bacteroidetes bacterium]|nr:ThiF family adenylyltransferase [Bacteroidota bacterium]
MIHWFKKHPQILRNESKMLANDANYKELYQFRKNLFVSHGEIIVRLDKIYKYPFLIVYTDAMPYALPQIYPLKQILPKQLVEYISGLPLVFVPLQLQPYIEFHYNLRHQNSLGALCVLEWDNLDVELEFFGIKTILKRIREWCTALITNNFPPDSPDVDFCAHFNNVFHGLKIIYPEEFLDEKIVQGLFYANVISIVPKGRFLDQESYVYSGILLDGKNAQGQFISKSVKEPLDPKLKTSEDFQSQNKLLADLVERKIVLKGAWFQLKKEPMPFKTFKDLVKLVGEDDYIQGIKRFHDTCSEYLETRPENLYVGIRFPNRRGDMEFQMFRTTIKDEPVSTVYSKDPLQISSHIIESYENVAAIESEKLTPDSFFMRNGARAKYPLLSKVGINIIGVGALGSEIADNIGKAGVGTIILIDNQVMKAQNAVRHLAGIEAIAQDKVSAVAKILCAHNPFLNVHPVKRDVLYSDFSEYTLNNSLSISSIADDHTEGFINEQAIIYNREVFYVRALRGGKVGRIFRVVPGKDACMQCLNLYRREGREFIEIPEDPDYPTLKNECNNPIRPASASDLKLLASIVARLAIEHIQNGPSKSNHWIWSTEKIDGTAIDRPYQLTEQFIPCHPQCHSCNYEKVFKVEIKKGRLEFMQSLVAQDPDIETGGVLAGYINDDATIVVTEACGPGPKAIRSATRFQKDTKYCQEFLDTMYKRYGEKAIYVGEWHSHPSKNNNPSEMDIKSLTQISLQQEYLTDKPLMIILSNEGDPSCTIHPSGKLFYKTNIATIS